MNTPLYEIVIGGKSPIQKSVEDGAEAVRITGPDDVWLELRLEENGSISLRSSGKLLIQPKASNSVELKVKSTSERKSK